MRRFFRAQRPEDYSQIQYLTAKCQRLTHERAVLERECVVAREHERSLQNDVEALTLQLCQTEQLNVELRVQHDQLLHRLKHEQGMVEFLQQQMSSVEEDSSRETAVLGLQIEQVSRDLQLLQSSEVQLVGLVDELHGAVESLETQLDEEAQHRAQLVGDLEAQLHCKICDLEELQKNYDGLSQELQELHKDHERTVLELQEENARSLQKLRDTAEQFEWLCEQQRSWMCCVKRFKDCLSEEKEALVLKVQRQQEELAELRKSSESPGQVDSPLQPYSRLPSWNTDVITDLQAEVDRWRGMYEDLFSKLTVHQDPWEADEYEKPP